MLLVVVVVIQHSQLDFQVIQAKTYSCNYTSVLIRVQKGVDFVGTVDGILMKCVEVPLTSGEVLGGVLNPPHEVRQT